MIIRLASLLAILASPVLAFNPSNLDPVDVCSHEGNVSELIMTGRQDEIAMSTWLQPGAFGPEGGEVTAWMHDRARSIVIKAYERPSYTTEKHQKRAIKEFRNEVELDCFRMMEAAKAAQK